MTGGPSATAASLDDGWAGLRRDGRLAQFVLLILGVWLNAADTLVTVTVMPSVVRQIGGYAFFGWATGAFLLGAICSGAAAGVVARRIGLRSAMTAAGAAYALGCLADALAPRMDLFLVGRLIQGLGSGAIVGLAYVAVAAVFPERTWARVFSAMTGVWGVATVLGPLVGGVFAGASGGGWRGAFLFFSVQGVIFFAASARLLPAHVAEPAPERRAPWLQLLLLALAVLALAAAGIAGAAERAVASTILGLALLTAAIAADARARDSMMPHEALRLDRPAGAGFAMVFLLQAAVVPWSIYGGALLQALDRVTPLTSGYVVSGEALGWTLCALPIAGLPDRFHASFIRIGPIVVAAGLAILAFVIGKGGLAGPALASTIMGAGFGLFWSFLNRRILASLPASERSLGSSAIPTAQMIGGAVGAAAASALGDVIGLGERIGPDVARRAGPLLFAAFLPPAVLAAACALRAAGPPQQGESAHPAARLKGES